MAPKARQRGSATTPAEMPPNTSPREGMSDTSIAAVASFDFLAVSIIWRIGKSRLMDAKTQLPIPAETEHKRLVHHHLVARRIVQIDIAHGDRDVTMDLDAVLR